MIIRQAEEADLSGLLELYTQLHDNPLPEKSEALSALWETILRDRNQYLIVAEVDGKIVSSCVLIIVPNLTHRQRPYALIENVVTDREYRKQGLAGACLARAKEIAEQKACYKIMLLTGSKENTTLDFYRNAGYRSEDKTGFVQWL